MTCCVVLLPKLDEQQPTRPLLNQHHKVNTHDGSEHFERPRRALLLAPEADHHVGLVSLQGSGG